MHELLRPSILLDDRWASNHANSLAPVLLLILGDGTCYRPPCAPVRNAHSGGPSLGLSLRGRGADSAR